MQELAELEQFAKKTGVKLQHLDVQAWLRPFHRNSVLWWQPMMHLLNTDLKWVNNTYATTYFTIYVQ